MTGASIDVSARTLLCGRLARLATFALLTLVLTATTASGQYCTPDQCDECNLCRCSQRCCHDLPELWLVNTRCAPRCKNLDCGFDRLIYKRYDRKCCRWVRESRETFLANEATMPTLFYAHGNSLNHKNAMKGCWQVYCKMRCCPGQKRLVFWSWPAERVFKTEGLRIREMIDKNLRIKYVYAEYQGYYMAKLVNQMSLSQRVMMSGHSYGGITTSSAAHFIGGGCLRGLNLAGGAEVERPNLRAAVISGAFDHDMLNPGNRYGQAFVAAEKIFVTRNVKDSTLKKWPKTSWRCKRAIGVLGVNANCLGAYRSKLCQQTMTADVGKSHYLKPHLKSVRFVAALCCLSFPQCSGCSPMAANTTPTDPEMVACEAEFAPFLSNPSQGSPNELEQQFVDSPFHDDDQFVFDEAETFELNSTDVFGTDEIELGVTPELDPTVLQADQYSLTAATGLNTYELQEVFAEATPSPARFNAVPYNIEAFASETYLANISSTPLDLQHDDSAQENPTSRLTTEVKSLSNQPPLNETMNTTATKPGKVSSARVWYRCGLCLAIVLTGQFYILFSKRVTPS